MSSSLSVNTLKSYKKQLGGARHLFFPLLSSPCFEELLLSPPKQILTLDVPPNTARSYVVAVMALAKAARPLYDAQSLARAKAAWNELLADLKGRVRAKIESNTRSEREQKAHASMEEWRAVQHKVHADAYASPQHLLVSFHVDVPPLRGGDLAHVAFGKHDEGNTLDGNLLTIRTHKTARTYGALQRVLPDTLVDAIAESLRQRPRTHLFERCGGGAHSMDSYFAWKKATLRPLFHRPVTTNSMRHEFISRMDRNKLTTREKKDFATQMGHSVLMQDEYVRHDAPSTP